MNNKYAILMVDDDVEFVKTVTAFFESEGGFSFTCRHDGKTGAETAIEESFDAILLDVTMPEINGFEALRQIRKHKTTPVIMLTARGDDLDRILGLEIGSDDYLPKPCNLRELLARVRALLRRAKITESDSVEEDYIIRVGDILVNTKAQTVQKNQEHIHLTGAEFLVLEKLIQSIGEIVSKDDISRHALGRRIMPYDRSVDVHIGSLRSKLGPTSEGLQRIKSVRGRGYMYIKLK